MAISSNKECRFGFQGQSDEVVVIRVVGNDTRGVLRVIKQDPLLLEARGQTQRVMVGDAVLLGNSRVLERLSDLVDQPGTDDQLKKAVLPGVQ